MSDDNPKSFPLALSYKSFDECEFVLPKTWLINGALALGEDSSWYGPPGEGKSGLLTDIAVHVASGRDWRGYKFNRSERTEDVEYHEYRGVVYFALERAGLTQRRLRAYMQRDGLAGLPIAVIPCAIDLLDPNCVATIQHTLLQFFDDTGASPGLVIIDTWGKAVAGGDEDKAATQNLAAKHIVQIRAGLRGAMARFHLASIGHSGKNLGAGERGSNARKGHVDMEVQVNNGLAKITKANDQDEGELTRFEFEKVHIAGDEERDIKPWSTTILAATRPATDSRTSAFKPLTSNQSKALDALSRTIAERGKAGAVPVGYWKEELSKVGLVKPNDANARTTFKRIRDALSQRIIEVDGFVRVIVQPGQIPPCPVSA